MPEPTQIEALDDNKLIIFIISLPFWICYEFTYLFFVFFFGVTICFCFYRYHLSLSFRLMPAGKWGWESCLSWSQISDEAEDGLRARSARFDRATRTSHAIERESKDLAWVWRWSNELKNPIPLALAFSFHRFFGHLLLLIPFSLVFSSNSAVLTGSKNSSQDFDRVFIFFLFLVWYRSSICNLDRFDLWLIEIFRWIFFLGLGWGL